MVKQILSKIKNYLKINNQKQPKRMSKFQKTKMESESLRTKSMNKMFNAFSKMHVKIQRVRDQILTEIQNDKIFNDLTSINQTYSF